MKFSMTKAPSQCSGASSAMPTKSIGHLHWLNVHDVEAVARYEQMLYADFRRIVKRNPLIRDLWDWDDEHQRLRTRVPYTSQKAALLSDAETGEINFATGVNVQVDCHWQSGVYGFPQPEATSGVCEFLIMAGRGKSFLNGISIYGRFASEFLFPELLAYGYHTAFSTTADHLLKLYRWCGAERVDERVVNGHRRTLLRWQLDKKSRRF